MTDAQDDISKAEDLFLGKNYSRMLLSVNLPNESKETTEFVDFLIGKVKEIFGDDACVTGEIVSTCILMGATIDYGILMSSNYVAYRGDYDRKRALELSVETAMPTVFSSGMILTVCGFVIHFISSQNSISTVGLLIGTVCSVIMITVVLPSVLYLLDKFVLKLSLKKKK